MLVAVACSEVSFHYSTGAGKRSIWSELPDDLDLEGDEQVLDVGYGQGAVPIAAVRTDKRAGALCQAARVLRPGGRLRIVDDKAAGYAEPLRDAGCVTVIACTLDWRTWFDLPSHHLKLVMATKGPVEIKEQEAFVRDLGP